jgi:catechol 2,3-dioxygenase-like lactoylglutathione lyase family enzyme
MAAVRYIVEDIDKAVQFYRDLLGFAVDMHQPGKFASLKREDLNLFLNAPGAGSAGKAGGDPKPGGWARFMIITTELDQMISDLKSKGARFRGQIAEGAGRQILVEDPSGNVVELFEYKQQPQ